MIICCARRLFIGILSTLFLKDLPSLNVALAFSYRESWLLYALFASSTSLSDIPKYFDA